MHTTTIWSFFFPFNKVWVLVLWCGLARGRYHSACWPPVILHFGPRRIWRLANETSPWDWSQHGTCPTHQTDLWGTHTHKFNKQITHTQYIKIFIKSVTKKWISLSWLEIWDASQSFPPGTRCSHTHTLTHTAWWRFLRWTQKDKCEGGGGKK